MLRDVEVQDPPTVVTDDEETVEYTEGDGGNGEEVHRGNRFSMIAQECQPAPCRFGVPRRSFHPPGNRPLRNIDTQHE